MKKNIFFICIIMMISITIFGCGDSSVMSGDAATYEVSNTDRNNEDSAYQGDSENENAINSSFRIDEPISISSVNSKTSFFDC